MPSPINAQFEACRSCSDRNNFKPPCVNPNGMMNYNLMLFPLEKMGLTCPLRAEWPKIRELAAHPQSAGRVESKTLGELQELGKGLAAGKPPSAVGIFQQNVKDKFGNSLTVFNGLRSQGGGPFFFLWWNERGRLIQHQNWFVAQGLDRAASAEQERQITDVRYALNNPPPKPAAPAAPKVTGKFVRYLDINEPAFYEAMGRAHDRGGTLGNYYREVYLGNVRLTFQDFRNSCANVESAFVLALTQYLPQELAKKCPQNYWAAERQFVAAGMELLHGLSIVAGATVGAVVLGAMAGGAVGSVVPVIGTAGGAQAGASIAFLIANWIGNAVGFMLDMQTYKDFGTVAGTGFDKARNGDPDGGGRLLAVAIAGILGTILVAMILRHVFKGPKGKELESAIEEDAAMVARRRATRPNMARILDGIVLEEKELEKTGYLFRRVNNDRFVTEEVSGLLKKPSQVLKKKLDRTELKKISEGTGEHAGHRIARRFGGPDCPENLGLQNPNINTWSPKAVRDEYYCTDGGASYYKLEAEWAQKLEDGWSIFVIVRDQIPVNGKRPAYRDVTWTEVSPTGVRKERTLAFANTPSPQSTGEYVPNRK